MPSVVAGDLDVEHEKLINEEYKIWKKNSPYLYDLVITHALNWPSLTVEWFPDIENPFPEQAEEGRKRKDVCVQRILLGTHTSLNEPNFLHIASISMPNSVQFRDVGENDGEDKELESYVSSCKIEMKNNIYHDGEINRARYMPQNPCLIATKCIQGDVLIFDYTKHPSSPTKDHLECNPDMRLVGHTKEGYGLDWNTLHSGYLLSCSEDRSICIWDLNNFKKSKNTLDPIYNFRNNHSQAIEDVSWHRFNKNIFGSVGDDSKIMIWDLRSKESDVKTIDKAHESEINCIDFSPKNEHLFATGGSDKVVSIWDDRNLRDKMYSIGVHGDDVLKVAWSPHFESILGSSGADRRVNIYDLSRIGEEQDEEDKEDGPPELLFIHGGHTNKVSDFSWNPNNPWMVASVSDDNILQVWKMTSHIYEDDDDGEEENKP